MYMCIIYTANLHVHLLYVRIIKNVKGTASILHIFFINTFFYKFPYRNMYTYFMITEKNNLRIHNVTVYAYVCTCTSTVCTYMYVYCMYIVCMYIVCILCMYVCILCMYI